MAVADVFGQFSQIWSDVIRCGPMWSVVVRCGRLWSDAVISHTAPTQALAVTTTLTPDSNSNPNPNCIPIQHLYSAFNHSSS